jgi:hypothetical protein
MKDPNLIQESEKNLQKYIKIPKGNGHRFSKILKVEAMCLRLSQILYFFVNTSVYTFNLSEFFQARNDAVNFTIIKTCFFDDV